MRFTGKQLAAILRIGKQMVMADGVVADSEMQVVFNELQHFGVESGQIDELLAIGDEMQPAMLLSIISEMDDEQKLYVCAYLGAILAIDGDIDDSEMKLWTLTSSLCGLPTMSIGDALRYMDQYNE